MTQPSDKASDVRGRKGAGFGDDFAAAISCKNHFSEMCGSAIESLFVVATTVTINAVVSSHFLLSSPQSIKVRRLTLSLRHTCTCTVVHCVGFVQGR